MMRVERESEWEILYGNTPAVKRDRLNICQKVFLSSLFPFFVLLLLLLLHWMEWKVSFFCRLSSSTTGSSCYINYDIICLDNYDILILNSVGVVYMNFSFRRERKGGRETKYTGSPVKFHFFQWLTWIQKDSKI